MAIGDIVGLAKRLVSLAATFRTMLILHLTSLSSFLLSVYSDPTQMKSSPTSTLCVEGLRSIAVNTLALLLLFINP